MSIRTVVFDFGNVLGYFSHRKGAEQLAALAHKPVSADDVLHFLYHPELEPVYESGQLSSTYVLDQLRDRFDLRGTDAELAVAFADIFWPYEANCALVPRLQGAYRLYLLSNTNDLHYRQFRRQFADVLDCFDALITSHEVGMRKPDCRIYRHVEQLAGCSAAECLFIDDLPANVEAARACGWHGIIHRQGDNLKQQLREVGIVA